MTGARIEDERPRRSDHGLLLRQRRGARREALEALLQSVEHCASCANAETKRLSLTWSTTPEAHIDAAAKQLAEALRGPEGGKGSRLSSLSVRLSGGACERAFVPFSSAIMARSPAASSAPRARKGCALAVFSDADRRTACAPRGCRSPHRAVCTAVPTSAILEPDRGGEGDRR